MMLLHRSMSMYVFLRFLGGAHLARESAWFHHSHTHTLTYTLTHSHSLTLTHTQSVTLHKNPVHIAINIYRETVSTFRN